MIVTGSASVVSDSSLILRPIAGAVLIDPDTKYKGVSRCLGSLPGRPLSLRTVSKGACMSVIGRCYRRARRTTPSCGRLAMGRSLALYCYYQIRSFSNQPFADCIFTHGGSTGRRYTVRVFLCLESGGVVSTGKGMVTAGRSTHPLPSRRRRPLCPPPPAPFPPVIPPFVVKRPPPSPVPSGHPNSSLRASATGRSVPCPPPVVRPRVTTCRRVVTVTVVRRNLPPVPRKTNTIPPERRCP